MVNINTAKKARIRGSFYLLQDKLFQVKRFIRAPHRLAIDQGAFILGGFNIGLQGSDGGASFVEMGEYQRIRNCTEESSRPDQSR